MFFLTPRHIKQAREMAKEARKLLAYKRDLWAAKGSGTVEEFEAGIRTLETATQSRKKEAIEEAGRKLGELASARLEPVSNPGWRENCEVFLVAIVVALGVRTYFLQPFTIPTGSMQPTLNGIIGYKTQESPPNILVRTLQAVTHGRTWVEVVAEEDDMITSVTETSTLGFFTKTHLKGQKSEYSVNCPQDTLMRYFLPQAGPFKKGDVLVRGYYETGDHVFVDKISYHFRKPRRGEVFVFNTQNIPTRENRNSGMQGPSQYYIKRLAGLPGDKLQIQPPKLFINDGEAQGANFGRVMGAQNGYRGYSNESEGAPDARGYAPRFPLNWTLREPKEIFKVPSKAAGDEEDCYFALGDNSFHSSDSRDWGPVPQRNLMGCGLLVYWPFAKHWGPMDGWTMGGK